MILLLGFEAFPPYETEYYVTGDDARRLLNTLGAPQANRTNPVLNVTIHSEVLDNEGETGDIGRGGGADRNDSLELFTA